MAGCDLCRARVGDERLAAPEALDVERHLARCDRCLAAYLDLKTLVREPAPRFVDAGLIEAAQSAP